MHCVRPKSQQRGLTMFGFLFVAVVLVMVTMLAMKLVPAYIEFFSVKKILATMGQDPEIRSKSNAEIRDSFSKRASTGYVTVVKPEDLSIDRRGSVPVISADYVYRTKLVGNISLVVDFSASSDPNAARADVDYRPVEPAPATGTGLHLQPPRPSDPGADAPQLRRTQQRAARIPWRLGPELLGRSRAL